MPRQLWNSMLNSSAYQTLIIQVLNYSNNSRTKYIPTRSKLQSTYFTSRVSIFDSSHHPCLAFIAQTVTLTSTDSWYLTAPPSEDIVMARFWNYMALSRTCPHPEAPHITSNLAEYIREGELKMISIQFISIADRPLSDQIGKFPARTGCCWLPATYLASTTTVTLSAVIKWNKWNAKQHNQSWKINIWHK